MIYKLLWIFLNVCGDLIEEKLLCWLLELLSMFRVNKNYVLKNYGFIAFHMYYGCVKEKKINKMEKRKKYIKKNVNEK